MRSIHIALIILTIALRPANAVSITGADWIVHFNLPDQSASTNNASGDEYRLRDMIIARLSALQTNQSAMLTAYSFGAMNLITGAAGPVLNSLKAALDRGARISMALDYDIVTTATNANGVSLANLASRATNPLVIAQATSSSGIMHEKLGLFDYGPTNRWSSISSWNYSQDGSTAEWNITLEVRNDDIYAACSNEIAQLMAGRFHYNLTKSHAHDAAPFLLPGSWTNGWIRFAPFTNMTDGGNNAQRDITNRIANAREEIVFALNDLTRPLIASQLVFACNRGVIVNGVMPRSDTDPGGASDAVFSFLTNSASYATTNRVRFWPARQKADGSVFDDGSKLALVHAKWMAIDPFGDNPWVIHGSANWSLAALVDNNSNDENILFIPHSDIARVFYSHFKRITGAFHERDDFWLTMDPRETKLWLTDTNAYSIGRASDLFGAWNYSSSISNIIGPVVITNGAVPVEFIRVRRN